MKSLTKISGLSSEGQSVIHYLGILLRSIIYIVSITISLSILGVPTESLIAILASSGLALGFGLKSHISSMASGLLMQIFQSIHLGDLIKIGSYEGKVKKLDLFTTILITESGSEIIVPNNKLTSDLVENKGKMKG